MRLNIIEKFSANHLAGEGSKMAEASEVCGRYFEQVLDFYKKFQGEEITFGKIAEFLEEKFAVLQEKDGASPLGSSIGNASSAPVLQKSKAKETLL